MYLAINYLSVFGELDDVLDATECERDIRLPRGLVGGGIRREVAGAPRHHIGIQRFCDKETFSITARARASLVANVVDAIDVEPVSIEVFTDLLTGHVCGDGLVASLIGARFGIVFEILAEYGIRQRFFHGGISAVLSVGDVYGDKCRLAAYGAEAHVVFHILVGNLISIKNVAIAVGFIDLDGSVEGKVHNGTAESLLAIEIGISDLVLVPSVHLCELQGIKTLVENASKGLGIGLAVLRGREALIFI